jgi:hypothetical protein
MSALATNAQRQRDKDSPTGYRAQLSEGAVARAADRLNGQEPDVRAEVLERLNAEAAEAVTRHAGALIDQMEANENARRRLEERVENHEAAHSALVFVCLLVIIIYSIAGLGSGKGGLNGVLIGTGWRSALATSASVLAFPVPALIIWAIVSWLRVPRPKRLIAQRERFDMQASRLRSDAENVLDTDWVGQVIAEELGKRLNASFTSTLRFTDPSMFASSSTRPVDTRAFRELAEIFAGLDRGSIGLCGPRGVGKTTLIHHFCRSTEGRDQPQAVGICVDVPVMYDQRDFLANTYARLIDEVELRVVSGMHRAKTRLRPLGWIVALCVAFATVGLASRVRFTGSARQPRWLEVAAISLYAVAAVAACILVLLVWRAHSRAARAAADPLERIREYAARGRMSLSADVALSSSLTGSITLPWAGIVRSGTRQVSRGRVSYPDLVRDFQEFVARLAAAGLRTRIGIDELDKLEPDEARSFLNGLKALFGLPGTHFLVSVSENAMSDFERRGIPMRDAFDSSLDEIIRVKAMNAAQSMALINSRGNYEFPLAFGALCHCLSGGLPRETLRVARALVRLNARSKGSDRFGLLKALCEEIIAQDLEAKSDALWVVARSIDIEPYSMRFRSWLADSDANQHSAEELLSTCQAYLRIEPLERGYILEKPESAIGLERLASLALEFAGYKYFAATLLDFFSPAADQDLRSALNTDAGSGGIDALSSARSRFADDPRLAWSLVTLFRHAHQITPALPSPTEGHRLPLGQAPAC